MNNSDIASLMSMLSKMDKKELEKNLQKVSQMLASQGQENSNDDRDKKS